VLNYVYRTNVVSVLVSYYFHPRVLSPFRCGGIAYLIDPDSYAV